MQKSPSEIEGIKLTAVFWNSLAVASVVAGVAPFLFSVSDNPFGPPEPTFWYSLLSQVASALSGLLGAWLMRRHVAKVLKRLD